MNLVFKQSTFVGLLLTTFLIVTLLGPMHAMKMPVDQNGHMTGCMFSGTAICTMTPLEHFAAWQAMFSATLANSTSTFLLLLLLALVLLVRIVGTLPFKEPANRQAVRQRLYARHTLAFAYANSLQEAFSQGILNPKVY